MTAFPPGTEVARLRLPLPVAPLGAATKALERLYGKDLVLDMATPGWWIVRTPGEVAS